MFEEYKVCLGKEKSCISLLKWKIFYDNIKRGKTMKYCILLLPYFVIKFGCYVITTCEKKSQNENKMLLKLKICNERDLLSKIKFEKYNDSLKSWCGWFKIFFSSKEYFMTKDLWHFFLNHNFLAHTSPFPCMNR